MKWLKAIDTRQRVSTAEGTPGECCDSAYNGGIEAARYAGLDIKSFLQMKILLVLAFACEPTRIPEYNVAYIYIYKIHFLIY